MGTEVGYRIRGIEPADLGRFPDSVKLAFWKWVVEFGLQAKDRDLAKGLDKDGQPLRGLTAASIRRRKSEVGPTDKYAPPLQPSHARSRVRSLLTGRAHTNSAEFWWKFDPVTGRSFARVLQGQRDRYGRDVFGLSPMATAWVKAQALKKWERWKLAGNTSSAKPASVAARQVASQPKGRPPAFVIPVQGRVDIGRSVAGAGADDARTRRAIAAGTHTGFRRLNARGEQWRPGSGAPAGKGGRPPRTFTPGQRAAVEKALAVPFKPAPRAAAERERVVLVDVRKLEDSFAATSPGRYIGQNATGAGDPLKYARFQRFVMEARATEKAVEMPRVFLGEGDPIFRDGAHRFAVLRDQGAAVIPVTVPAEDYRRFIDLFGASVNLLRAVAGAIRSAAG
jgi:hypothetical protein